MRNGQRVFNEAVEAYLRRSAFGDDGYARLVQLPTYEGAEVVVDPAAASGSRFLSTVGSESRTL